METVTLPNGHIILPHEIYRRLGLEVGMRLEVDFDPKTGCIRLRPVRFEHAPAGRVSKRIKMKRNEEGRRTK
jgi:bifunctional DNA-binding transcriptional regulator/antitoxin component of YhaV-PrlF toxin-antitoxin module